MKKVLVGISIVILAGFGFPAARALADDSSLPMIQIQDIQADSSGIADTGVRAEDGNALVVVPVRVSQAADGQLQAAPLLADNNEERGLGLAWGAEYGDLGYAGSVGFIIGKYVDAGGVDVIQGILVEPTIGTQGGEVGLGVGRITDQGDTGTYQALKLVAIRSWARTPGSNFVGTYLGAEVTTTIPWLFKTTLGVAYRITGESGGRFLFRTGFGIALPQFTD